MCRRVLVPVVAQHVQDAASRIGSGTRLARGNRLELRKVFEGPARETQLATLRPQRLVTDFFATLAKELHMPARSRPRHSHLLVLGGRLLLLLLLGLLKELDGVSAGRKDLRRPVLLDALSEPADHLEARGGKVPRCASLVGQVARAQASLLANTAENAVQQALLP